MSNIVQGIRFDTIESLIGSRLIESSEGLPIVAEFYEVEDGFAFIVVQMAIARIPTGLQPTIAFDHSCQAANIVRRRVAAHKADTGYIVFVAIYQRHQHFAAKLRTNILLQLPAVAAGATVRAVRYIDGKSYLVGYLAEDYIVVGEFQHIPTIRQSIALLKKDYHFSA